MFCNELILEVGRKCNLKCDHCLIGEAQDILRSVREEEQEAYENLPDNFRDGEKGEEMQNYMEMIEEAEGYLDDANSVIEQI